MRLWERTERAPTGCLEWQGPVDGKGYGRVDGGKLAHRVAYRLAKGDPGPLCVLHTCDNPPCINPEHLWLGTRGDNNRDAAAKGRHAGMNATHCPNGHEWTAENTYQRPGRGISRDCRACIRARAAKYKRGKAA